MAKTKTGHHHITVRPKGTVPDVLEGVRPGDRITWHPYNPTVTVKVDWMNGRTPLVDALARKRPQPGRPTTGTVRDDAAGHFLYNQAKVDPPKEQRPQGKERRTPGPRSSGPKIIVDPGGLS